jgi:23S rRNA (uracil1939-C5)-methyltransferase
MTRKKNKYPLLEKLEIVDIAAEGKAVAKFGEMVVFVRQAVPGDVVDVKIDEKKKRYMAGYPVNFHAYSSNRIDPPCRHFGLCGGCKWQMLPYKDQLIYKQKQVEDQLIRIAKVDIPVIQPVIGSSKTFFYRNKLEYTFSSNRWLTTAELGEEAENRDMRAAGFHIPGMFDRILDIEECLLQDPISDRIRNGVKNFAKNRGLSFYDHRIHKGLLRNLIIRNTTSGELMVIMVFGEKPDDGILQVMQYLADDFPDITSLMYVVNEKLNDTIGDQEVLTWKGKDHMIEEMEGIYFKIGPKSFYQTNPLQAYELYRITREFAGLTGKEIVYDLYTGTGTIANFVARQSKKVIGVEYVPEAVEDARENARLNKIDNLVFYAGDMRNVLNDHFFRINGKPDVLILDPPRAGVHPDVISAILRASAERIVYVSCNPATQARDISLLSGVYKVQAVQPVDMFPQTHHIENVALLVKH